MVYRERIKQMVLSYLRVYILKWLCNVTRKTRLIYDREGYRGYRDTTGLSRYPLASQ